MRQCRLASASRRGEVRWGHWGAGWHGGYGPGWGWGPAPITRRPSTGIRDIMGATTPVITAGTTRGIITEVPSITGDAQFGSRLRRGPDRGHGPRRHSGERVEAAGLSDTLLRTAVLSPVTAHGMSYRTTPSRVAGGRPAAANLGFGRAWRSGRRMNRPSCFPQALSCRRARCSSLFTIPAIRESNPIARFASAISSGGRSASSPRVKSSWGSSSALALRCRVAVSRREPDRGPRRPARTHSRRNTRLCGGAPGHGRHRWVPHPSRRAGRRVSRSPVPDAPDLLRPYREHGVVVGLVGLTNHDNVGGIFRNAAAFGADAVLIDGATCDPLYRKAIRFPVGGSLIVPFAQAVGPRDARRTRCGRLRRSGSQSGRRGDPEFRRAASSLRASSRGGRSASRTSSSPARARSGIPMAAGFDSSMWRPRAEWLASPHRSETGLGRPACRRADRHPASRSRCRPRPRAGTPAAPPRPDPRRDSARSGGSRTPSAPARGRADLPFQSRRGGRASIPVRLPPSRTRGRAPSRP